MTKIYCILIKDGIYGKIKSELDVFTHENKNQSILF